MTSYEPGSITTAARELDPNGRAGDRLARKIERAMAGNHVAIAIDTLAFIMAQALIAVPEQDRLAVTGDMLDAIRYVVRESLQ